MPESGQVARWHGRAHGPHDAACERAEREQYVWDEVKSDEQVACIARSALNAQEYPIWYVKYILATRLAKGKDCEIAESS